MEYYSVTPFPPKKVESYHLHYMDERGWGSFMLSKSENKGTYQMHLSQIYRLSNSLLKTLKEK